MVLPTTTKVASLLALLCTTTFSLSIPQQPAQPEVPWKRRGLDDFVKARAHKVNRDGCEHGPEDRGCWGGEFSIETDMDLSWPDTGKTVRYHLEISMVNLSPDGFEKPMMVVNGQFPGPTIVADWGDDIEIAVTNNLETNGTSIHWHGLRQLHSNQMDGTNGLTECPIAPGCTKVYRFKATQYGSSWYHSHYSVQYGDGLVGGIIIHGPATANYDVDLGLMPLMDWFHAPMFTVSAASFHAKGPPIADNVLVNGSMTSPSGGDYAFTVLEPGKKHLLRFVNTGINNHINLALDGHEFTVIAADFVPIVPYTTKTLSLAIGQRYDVIIDASAEVANYWLRVGTGGGKCDGPNANDINIGSIFHYEGAPDALPDSEADGELPKGCGDETNLVPYVKTEVPQDMPEQMNLGFTNTAGSGNMVQWMINKNPMLIDFKMPTLQQIQDGVEEFKAVENVLVVGEAHKWQYWVIQQDNTTAPIPHSVHLHGHDFYILDYAENKIWNGDTSRLKTHNPIRRDTATLPARGYLVLAFESDNPGVWLMHCHIPFHIAAGFGVQFIERRDEIFDSIGSIGEMQDGCKAWSNWQGDRATVLDIGDSGLR